MFNFLNLALTDLKKKNAIRVLNKAIFHLFLSKRVRSHENEIKRGKKFSRGELSFESSQAVFSAFVTCVEFASPCHVISCHRRAYASHNFHHDPPPCVFTLYGYLSISFYSFRIRSKNINGH